MSFQRLRPPTDDSSHYDGDGGDHHDDGGCDDNDYYDYDDDCYDDDHLSVGDYNYELSQDRDYPFGPGNDDYYNINGPPGYSGPPPRPGFTFRRGRPGPPQPGFPFKRGRPGPPQPDFPFRRGRPGPSQPDFPSRGGPPGPHQPDFPFRGGPPGPHQPDFPFRGGPPGPHHPDFPFRGGPHHPDFPFRGGPPGPHQPDFAFRGGPPGPHQPEFPSRGGPPGPHQPDFPSRGGPPGPHQPDFPSRGGPPGPHQPDFPSRGGPPGPSLRRFPNRRDQAPRANLINIQAHGDIPRHTFDSYVTQKGAIERQKLLQDLSQKQIKVASLKAEMGKLVREQNEIMQQTGVVNANLPQLTKIETVMASLTEEVEGLLKASFCTPTCEKINVSEETRGKEPPTKKQKPLVTEKCKVSAKSKIAKEKLAGQEQVTPVVDVPSGRMNLPCVEINSDKFHERSFPVVESATKISDAGGISSVVKSGSAQMNSGLYGDSILPAADSARTNSSTKAGSEAEKSKDVATNVGDHAAMGQWRLPPIAQSYKQSQPYQHGGDSHGQASGDSTYSSSHSKAGDMKSQAIDDADIKQEKGYSKSSDKQRSSSSYDDRASSCDGHPCENLASSRDSQPRDDRTPAHGSHSHGTELKSILKKKTGEERVDAESKASSVPAGKKRGKDSELPDIQGQLNNQLGLRINRSSKVWQVASKEQAVSQVNHLFQDTGQAHNLASSSQAKKAGDNDDEELDSTVQNILQSIGFNSALSKRMQELVHQKKQQQDVLHTGMIKQSASSLGHSEQFAQDVTAASCSDKQEKMLRVRMTTRYGRGRSAEAHRGQAGNSRKGVSPEPNGGRSRMGLESHEIRSERPLNNSKYQDYEEVSPDEDEMGGMEPNGGRSRMGLESHEIRSERPLNNSKYQDWEEISPDEDEMGGVECRKIIEPIRSLSCAKHAEIRQRSFSRERAVASPPHSKAVLDETRKSKMMLCESQEKSVSLSERFEDEPKGTYFDSDDSESTKAAALLAAVLSSKFWGSISSSGSKSLTLPLQSGPSRVENLRVTRTVHSDDDEPYIESRKVILPSKSDVRIVSQSPVVRKSQSPEMKVPRKRPASPLLFPVSKERRDFSEKGSYSDLNALLIRSLEDIAPEICQALCLGVGSFNNSSLSQAVLGGLIVGGLPAAERAESPVMSDCFNRGIRRKLPDRQILRSPNGRTSRSLVRQILRSPNGRTSRSPGRQLSRSPERRKSGSSDSLVSKSPYRIKSPDILMSKSTIRRKSKSPYRRKSPDRLVSKSTLRRKSKSPYRRKSPDRRKSISPSRRRSRSPYRHKSRSPYRHKSRSPDRRRSRSPDRHRSRSPYRRRSRSPYRHKSRSPDRRRSRSPDRQRSRILYESKRAPKKKTD